MIDQLLRYDAIGWDFDGTLIEHPYSELLQDFIIAHPEKRHIIVTFRTHGYQRVMFRDMTRLYRDSPRPAAFTDILNISDKAWEQFTMYQQKRVLDQLDGPLNPWEEYYVEWKGMACHKAHVPVLVDDMTDLVMPGCIKYGIDYLHPDELG